MSRVVTAWMLLFSILAPSLVPIAQAAASEVGITSQSDTRNSLETVGTKANRLKTVGASGVDEATGALTYSYPFATPKGKFSLEPSLVISYNSQSSENSIVGYGMTLAIPYIERTSKNGVDKMFTDNNAFVSSLGGELILKEGSTNSYVQKFDDGSYQLYTLQNNIWTLIDRSGNTYTFGQTVDSRQADESGTKISKFYLNSVKDLLGNQINYFYEKKNAYVYPKEIAYTLDRSGSYSNRIVFERENRLDEEISYRSGFLTTLSDRLKSIKAYTDNNLIAQLDLKYTTGQNGLRSLLSSIKESRVGTDGILNSLPETKFEYEKGLDFSESLTWVNADNGRMSIDINGDAKPEYLDTKIDYNGNYVVIDVNGDYLPDMYSNRKVQPWGTGIVDGEKNIYKKNIGGAFIDLPLATYSLPLSHFMGQGSWWYDKKVTVADVNGDGLQDLLNTSSVSLSNGKGFETSDNFANTDLDSLQGDFNGDGLIDKVNQDGNVYLNNGKGWNTNPELGFKIPTNLKVSKVVDEGWRGKNTYTFDAGVRFVDVNLDGLPDIIRSYTIPN